MEKKRYMTTGEFAGIMNVTKETLFHYDRIGLFSPEVKGKNGYRYYGTQQIDVLDTILLLRELDIPLEEIKEFMDRRNPEKLLELFEMEEKLILKQQQKLKDHQRWIRKQREKIRTLQKVNFLEIYRKYFPTRYYWLENVQEFTPQVFTKKINSLINSYQYKNSSMCFDIAYLQFEQDIKNHQYTNYRNVLLLMDEKPKGRDANILEEGEYLVTYHVGHWDSIGEAYQRLMAYARKEDIWLEQFFFEYSVMDALMAKTEEEFVTEICVRILNDSQSDEVHK